MAGLKFLSQFKKDMAKLDTVSVGIRDTTEWLSLGNFALNRIMSGNYFRGIPLGKISLLAGPSGCVPAEQTVRAVFIDIGEAGAPVMCTEGQMTTKGSELISVATVADLLGVDVDAVTVEGLAELFHVWCDRHAEIETIADVELATLAGCAVFVEAPSGFTQVTRFITKQPRSLVRITTDDEVVSGRFSVDHLINTLTNDGHEYTPCEKLSVGDRILNVYNDYSTITEIEYLGEEEVVYDLEVANPWHAYYVGGVYSHNSGKSFLSGNAVVQAQREGFHVVYLDSEHAVDVDYLKKIGASVDEEHLTYLSVTTIEDVNVVLSDFFTGYRKEYGKNNPEGQKVLIVLDSLAMLSSTTEMENYEGKGVIKGDQGQLAKRRKAMLRLSVGQLGVLPIAMLLTDHVYPQDIMLGEGPWAVTNSTRFSTSLIGLVTKLKLKEGTEVVGVRMRVETYKSRFAKLGSKVELEVPYNKGMSPLSGLIEMLEIDGVIAKGTQPGEKTKWIAEWTDAEGDHRELFTEKTLTLEQATKILKGHPACQPMDASGEEPSMDEILAELDD